MQKRLKSVGGGGRYKKKKKPTNGPYASRPMLVSELYKRVWREEDARHGRLLATSRRRNPLDLSAIFSSLFCFYFLKERKEDEGVSETLHCLIWDWATHPNNNLMNSCVTTLKGGGLLQGSQSGVADEECVFALL